VPNLVVIPPSSLDSIELFLDSLSKVCGRSGVAKLQIIDSLGAPHIVKDAGNPAVSTMKTQASVERLQGLLVKFPWLKVTQIQLDLAGQNGQGELPAFIRYEHQVSSLTGSVTLEAKANSKALEKVHTFVDAFLEGGWEVAGEAPHRASGIQEIDARAQEEQTKTLTALQDVTSSLASHLAASVQKHESMWVEGAKKVNELQEKARVEAEEVRQKAATEAEAENAARLEELEAREVKATVREAQIDAQEFKDARRKRFEQLIEKLEAELRPPAKGPGQAGTAGGLKWGGITQETKGLRWPVQGLCFTLLVAFGVLAGLSVHRLFEAADSTNAVNVYLLLSPFAASALCFGVTGLFWVRFNSQWANAHAQREFHNTKLYIDSVRSGWLVELLLEWHEEKERGPFPLDLLEKLGQGLFERNPDRAPIPPRSQGHAAMQEVLALLKRDKASTPVAPNAP
jgi:hypothetical protein